VNVNALNSEMLSDFGFAPTFYSCLADVEKADDESRKKAWLKERGGKAGFLSSWRAGNPGAHETDEDIMADAMRSHPGLFS
jgi:hypothetical protein